MEEDGVGRTLVCLGLVLDLRGPLGHLYVIKLAHVSVFVLVRPLMRHSHLMSAIINIFSLHSVHGLLLFETSRTVKTEENPSTSYPGTLYAHE